MLFPQQLYPPTSFVMVVTLPQSDMVATTSFHPTSNTTWMENRFNSDFVAEEQADGEALGGLDFPNLQIEGLNA